MALQVQCQQHPNARAGWSCDGCRASLCLRCAYRRRAGQGWLIICSKCGSMAQPLMISRAVGSFVSSIPGAFVYPFSQAGLITMGLLGAMFVVLALLSSLLSAVAPGLVVWILFLIIRIVAAAMIVSYLFLVIRTTASGSNDVPEAEDLTHVWDMVSSLWRFAVATNAALLPFTIYVHYIKENAGLASYVTDPWIYVTLLVALLWAPMASMQAATSSPVASIINPMFAVAYIGRIFADYAVAAALFWLLAGATVVFFVLGEVLQASVSVPVLPHLYATAATLYFPIVGARVLGLLVYSRGDELGYGSAREYLEPVLGDALPPMEPAAVVAPVAPVQDVTEGFQSFSAMEGTGFQTIREAQSPAPMPLGSSMELPELSQAATIAESEYRDVSGGSAAIELGLAARAQAAAQYAPTSEQASDQDIRAMADAGRYDFVAKAYRDRLGVVDVLSAEDLRQTASAAASTGDLETAAHVLRRLAHDFPGSALTPEALLDAGVLLTRDLGQKDDGVALLNHLVAAYPQSKAADEALRLLQAEG